MGMLSNGKRREVRRTLPIHGYVGANGGGKSAAMVWDTLPTLLAGYPVLSTVRLLDFENPRPCDDPACNSADHEKHMAAHPLWQPLVEWEQLLEARDCDVLLDEVTGVASSRESASMPAPVANKLVQLRRADVIVRWSAPNWARADKIIRECSQGVTYCRGYLAKEHAEGGRRWRNRRLFKWSTYDAADFEDFTSGKREALKAMQVDLHWGPGSPAFTAYDTLDAVLTVGTVTDSGRCYRCGGRRSVPACRCDAVGKGQNTVAEEGPPQGDTEAPVAVEGRRRLNVIGN